MANEIYQLTEKINKFRDDRNWRQFHNEKDLAISLNLEASELLEIFQWKSSEEAIEDNFMAIKEELADVLMYAFMLADNLNIDITEIIESKLTKNAEKYPIEKSKNNHKKYTDL